MSTQTRQPELPSRATRFQRVLLRVADLDRALEDGDFIAAANAQRSLRELGYEVSARLPDPSPATPRLEVVR